MTLDSALDLAEESAFRVDSLSLSLELELLEEDLDVELSEEELDSPKVWGRSCPSEPSTAASEVVRF